MKAQAFETLVGAAVVAIALGFLIFAYQLSGFRGSASSGYHLTADFDSADGVAIGSDVRIAGIKVGSVVAQTLNPANFQAHLTMQIAPEVKISDDSSAKVTSEGLLGSKYISLEPGGSATKFADGDTISYTQGAVDMWSLISQAMFSKKTGDTKPADSKPVDPAVAPAP